MEITICGTPNNDFLKTEALLSDFRRTVRNAFNKIKFHHGCTELHVFQLCQYRHLLNWVECGCPKLICL